jgi:hypothetical protein
MDVNVDENAAIDALRRSLRFDLVRLDTQPHPPNFSSVETNWPHELYLFMARSGLSISAAAAASKLVTATTFDPGSILRCGLSHWHCQKGVTATATAAVAMPDALSKLPLLFQNAATSS